MLEKVVTVDQSAEQSDSEDHSALTTRILTEIGKGTYTCMVCTGDIDSSSKIWSCPYCYRVFDLECIRDWAKRGSSTMDDRSWRCPSCNGHIKKLPKNYTCWCGKVINPSENPLSPHSCGQTCGAPLAKCIHNCPMECHPGPHASKCGAMGPVMKCSCGKNERQLPCELTPYNRGWSCGEPCGDLLPCGLHRCKRICHSGLCGECTEKIRVKCYCGKHEQDISCHDREPQVSNDGTTKWIGAFECDDVCSEPLDCGNHKCQLPCHSITPGCHKCPRSPEALTHCACGKTDVKPGQRTSCLDPIPLCDQVCGKKLPCGHTCYWKCHEGPCSPCYRPVDVKCRCGFSEFSIACGLRQQGYAPLCHRKCTALMNCRRHYCERRCCEHEKVALERNRDQARRIRQRTLDPNSIDDSHIEAVHICTKDCGRVLSCGKHRCHAACHSGPCPSCMESSSEDLVCNCGRTVVPAPVRCGTKLPVCPYPCQRPLACGHPSSFHNCHPDSIKCPPCTVLVTRKCQCEKQIDVKNVLCSQKVVSCGHICAKVLPCGHKCQKVCHKPGSCEIKCTQICGKTLPCGHKCKRKCHCPRACDTEPCREMVIVTCKCGRRRGQAICCRHVPGTKLDCDDECMREQRSRALFEALKLDDPGHSLISPELLTQKMAVENSYTDFVLQLYRTQPVWCGSIETLLRRLTNGELNERDSHSFNPMKMVQRRFVHELAESYGMFSESQDPEPKRSVFVKTTKDTKVPMLSLKESISVLDHIEEAEQRRSNQLQVAEAWKSRAGEEPFNAIAITNVYFGVTCNKLEEAVKPIWQGLTQIVDAQIDALPDSVYVFYGANYKDRTQLQQAELASLTRLFESKLKDANLAMNCKLAKIDDSATVVYETGELDSATETTTPEETPEQTPEPTTPSKMDTSSFDWY